MIKLFYYLTDLNNRWTLRDHARVVAGLEQELELAKERLAMTKERIRHDRRQRVPVSSKAV